jgi:hypothetical protein
MTFPSVSLAQARQDVREKELALAIAEQGLEDTPACSIWVHSRFMPGCKRCEAFRAADDRVIDAVAFLESARARLDAIESQQRGPLHVGGER